MSRSSKLHIYLWLIQKSSVYHRLNNEFCGICRYVVISLNQLESRGRTSIKNIINLYIIAAQKNKDCVCFLYKQEPENTKSQFPVFFTDEHGLKCSCVQILWVALHIIKLYHAMLKQKTFPVPPLIQCEAGRAKTKLFVLMGLEMAAV